MKIKNQKMVNAIYQASHGHLNIEDVDTILENMTKRDRTEFLKLIRMLTIMHGCEELMETPENRMPI